MLPGELVSFMVELATELGLLGGFVGAMLYMLARGLCIALWRAVEGSEWYMDWGDRRYVSIANRDNRYMEARLKGTLRRVLRSQDGRITPAAACWLVAVVLAVLAACAAPEPRLTGSEQWWEVQRENAKRRGW